MVNGLNGSTTQQQIANPFQKRPAQHDSAQQQQQKHDVGKAANPQTAAHANQVAQNQAGQTNQVTHSDGGAKHHNASRGQYVDITV